MQWLSVASLVLKVVSGFLSFLERRELLRGRDAQIALSNLRAANSAIERARAARRGVDAGGVPDDPNNRDQW